MRTNSKAFTLIEILLVSSLVAILAIAIFRSFGNGLKLWGRAERLNKEAEVAIFLDKMAEDLRSATLISGLRFDGTAMRFSFPAIVKTKADVKSSRASEGIIDQIGAVQYRFDSASHKIFRRQANYAQAIKHGWSLEETTVAEGVEELSLYYEVASDKGFLFKSEVKDAIPLGVRVDIQFTDDNGPHQLKRFLPIPVGG